MGRVLLLSIFLCSLSIQAQVSAECPTLINLEQEFCETWVNKEYLGPFIENINAPSGVIWYSSMEGGEALSPSARLLEGTYYAAYDNCAVRQPVSVLVDSQPVAGRTSIVAICSNEGVVDLQTLVSPLAPADGRESQEGGYFTLNGDKVDWERGVEFNPAYYPTGKRLTFNYVKHSDRDFCYDETVVYLTINEAPNAGLDGAVELHESSAPVNLFDYLEGSPDGEGTWSPPLASKTGWFDPLVDVDGAYTYKVEGESCDATAVVEVSVRTDGKVTICHKGNTLEVNHNAVAAHQRHGDSMGTCDLAVSSEAVVFPNPSRGLFHISNKGSEISGIRILNFKGGLVREFKSPEASELMEIDLSIYKKGIYFAEVTNSQGTQIMRLIKK